MKNMFGGETKSKKEQKLIETTLKTIISTDKKEKAKNEACLKLIEIFENSLEINMNFDSLLANVEYLTEYGNSQFKRIWIMLAIQIIKFRSDYRSKLFTKMMKIIFELGNEDNPLKLRGIHCATNCCIYVQDLEVKILVEYLTFECLLLEEFQKEYLFVMILNLLKSEHFKISKFLIEFIIDCIGQICMKRFTILRELYDTPAALEEEIKSIKTIFQFFEFYMNFFYIKKNSIIKNIVVVYCIFVNYEREYCWKMMRNFLQFESKNILKYFLEIVYHYGILNKYCDLEDYFYYDNNDEYGLASSSDRIYFYNNAYKIFLEKLGDVNSIILKHNSKVIKGSIFFIGMSIWGYERIESLHIPNTIILSHFNKLINYSNTKIHQEIILCLRRLIKKYGETLTDEWNEIFSIIFNISIRDKSTFKDNTIKNLHDIFDSIKILIIQDKFFGKHSDYVQLLDEFKIYNNESLMLTKCRLKLSNYYSFVANLESVIIEYFINCKLERVRNYLMEVIRLNYSFTFNKNQIVKKKIIENLITKHFTSIIICMENCENLNFFSLLITEMCTLTNDLKFFDKIIKLIFNIHNDFRLYSNEGERSKYIWNFQKNTLIKICGKLSNTFQSEKLLYVNKKIYCLMKNKEDISILITILSLFKNFNVNKDYELIIKDNLAYSNKNLPSQLVINYKVQNSKKQKKVYENLKPKKLNIYEPYVVFKHNKIFDFLINLINQDETNTYICEEVLEYLAINLKTTFFFKGLKFDKLLNTIVCIDDIKKYATRKRFIDLIIDILVNTTFHLNSNTLTIKESMVNANLSTNIHHSISSTRHHTLISIRNISQSSNEICIELQDENLKERIIQFALNSLKSFVIILKNMINNYKKLINIPLSSQSLQSQRQESIKVSSVNGESFINTTTNNNVNINTIIEIIDSNLNNPLSITLRMNAYFIKKILSLISIYISSISIPSSTLIGNLNTKNLFNFYAPNFQQTNNSFVQQNKKLSDLINCLVEILFEMRNLIFFKLCIGISIIHLILSIKEILILCGEDIIIKIIFLILNIGWPNYEIDILKLFSDNFNIKFKKFELEKNKRVEKQLKREYVNMLADICCFYFIEKSSQGKTIWNIINNIFKSSSSNPVFNMRTPISQIRESIFLDHCKWQIYSKTNRDNIKAEFRSKIPPHAQVYLGKHSVIMLIPINKTSSEVIIRNPISNINITVHSNLENKNEIDETDDINILSNQIRGFSNEKVHSKFNSIDINNKNPTPLEVSTINQKSANSIISEFPANKEEINKKVIETQSDSNCFNINDYHSLNKIAEKGLNINEIRDIKNIKNCSAHNVTNSLNINSFPVENSSLYLNSFQNDNQIFLKDIINNSNVIFQQITNLLCEQDIKFQILENNNQIEDSIMNLDSTPVYYTFTCGVIYVPIKNLTSEFDILTYEGDVSQSYLKFLSSLGKVFSIVDNSNIYSGGLDKSGANGKYSILYQDNIFQVVYHVSNLIKLERKEKENSSELKNEFRNYQNELNNTRKRFIGNAYVNLIWLDNPFQDFDTNLIISGACLIYIVIYPISDSYYLIRIRYNKRPKFNFNEKISAYFPEDLCVNLNGQNLSNTLIRLIIQINLMVSYILQKTVFRKVENDQIINSSSITSSLNIKLTNQIYFENNITQRFKEIERINCRFKNNNIL